MIKIKKEFTEFKLLLRSIPGILTSFFLISVFTMNLLANKSISLPVDWLALDCGIIVSWFSFLVLDIITKHFGVKASNQLTVLAIAVNLAMCLVFFIASVIPGIWGESGVYGSEKIINTALDNTFGGTWYVLLGSTIAFAASALVNNFTNFGIGKLCKSNPDGIAAYVLRTYISTAIAQFVDNILFALIVSHFFFGWTIVQCITCAATGMLVELICEVAFSFIGYKICAKWKRENLGKEYFEFAKGETE